MKTDLIQTLRGDIEALQDQKMRILDAAEAENRKLLASESRQIAAIGDEQTMKTARVLQLRKEAEGREADATAVRQLGITYDSHGFQSISGFGNGADTVYGRTSGNSYFRDLLASAQPGGSEFFAAMGRLTEHAQLVERAADDLPHEFRATRLKRAAGSAMETLANPNRIDGQGGYFVPPLWLVDEFVALLRAGRPTADRCNRQDLPPGTDSINLPKVATGTLTALQSDGGAVSSLDMTDTFVTGPVRTIAGQNDVAMQLIEQSPAGFDMVIFGDLVADYNQKLDVQVLSGSGSGGQLKGIFNAGGNAVTFTSGSPTVPLFYVPITQALSQVAKARFLAPDSIVIHPSLWYWIVAALDSQNRPLVTPSADHGTNTIAVLDATAAQGVAGSIAGVPIVVDPNIPVNAGAGLNQSRVLVGRLQDNYLYEGALRTRALTEVLSGTLQVRLQVYNYIAQISDRYPVAYSYIDGTGLVVQSGY